MLFQPSVLLFAITLLSTSAASPVQFKAYDITTPEKVDVAHEFTEERRSVPLPPAMTTADFTNYANLPTKLLAINNFLNEGQLGSGKQPGYQNGGDLALAKGQFFVKSALTAGPGAPPRTTITELARTAVSIVQNQIFLDGNHRTASFTILEYLNSVGVIYTKSATRIYNILARMDHENTQKTIDALVQEVGKNTLKPTSGILSTYRPKYAKDLINPPHIPF